MSQAPPQAATVRSGEAIDYGDPRGCIRSRWRPPAEVLPPDWPQMPVELPLPVPAEGWGGIAALHGSVRRVSPAGPALVLEAPPAAERMLSLMGFIKAGEAPGAPKESPVALMRSPGLGAALAAAPLIGEGGRAALGIEEGTAERDLGPAPLLFKAPRHPAREDPRPGAGANLWLLTAPREWIGALKVAGWIWVPGLRAWGTRSLRNAAPFAAFASPAVAEELRRAGVPLALQRQLRHAPAMFPWRRRSWALAINSSLRSGYSAPPALWKAASHGISGWSARSALAAWRMRRYAPPEVRSFLEAQEAAGTLRRVKPAALNIIVEKGGDGGAGGPPGRERRPVVLCVRCDRIAAAPGVAKGGRDCKASPEACPAGAPGTGLPARAEIPVPELMALRPRMEPRAWRRFAQEIGRAHILGMRADPPLDREGVARLVSDVALRTRTGDPGRQLTRLQHEAVQWVLANPVALNATHMGGGKTPATLTALNVLFGAHLPRLPESRPALAVVPAFLRSKWISEAQTWLDPRIPRQAIRSRGRGIPRGGLVVASYETVRDRPDLAGIDWSAVVWEEAHYVKRPDAQRSRAVLALRSPRVIGLTGTPIHNRPYDLQPILSRACPDAFGDARRFRRAYSVADPQEPSQDEMRMLEGLGAFLRETLMFRPPKEEVMKGLPENPPPEVIEVSIEGAEAIRREEISYLRELAGAKGGRMAILAQLQALRLRTARGKLPAIREQVRLCGQAQAPVLAFSFHQEICAAIADGARADGLRTGMIDGGVPMDERRALVADFQAGRLDALSLTWGAGGEGLDMPAAEVVLFGELDWSPATMDQAEARAIRHGQTHAVRTIYMVASGTIDSHIAGTLAGKSQYQQEGLADASPESLLAALAAEDAPPAPPGEAPGPAPRPELAPAA